MALFFLALAGGATSCLKIDEMESPDGVYATGITIKPQVYGSVVTKAVGDKVNGDDTQMENDLQTLDVIFFGADQPEGNAPGNLGFRKVYHLTAAADQLQSGVEALLSERWKADNFKAGEHYDVYVVANSDNTKTMTEAAFTDIDVLKDLRENEWSEACVWDDGSINPAALTLHKQYAATMPTFPPNSGINPTRSWTTSKKYLMDGVVKGWSPVENQPKQVIPVNMSRAASKFIINVKFDEEFLHSLYAIKNSDGTWTPKDESKRTSIDGTPGWRFLNFAFDAPLFDHVKTFSTETAPKPEHVLSSGALIQGSAEYSSAADKNFTITTYAYPNLWESANAMSEAPAIALSVGFKTGDQKPVYNYYRIPVVNQATTTEIGRNKIYIVNATISAQGSTLLDEMEEIRVDYDVVDWVDPEMTGVDPSEIFNHDNVFLQVTPHTYTLRGDGQQSVNLAYFIPTGYHIGIQYFTSQANNETVAKGNDPGNVGVSQTIGADGVVTSTNTSQPAWYYNLNGGYMTSFQYGTGYTLGYNNSVTLTGTQTINLREGLLSVKDNNPSGNISRGSISVSSTAMYNKAVKYIVMRVFLAKDASGNAITDWYPKKLYRDIYIKHFPTDNVQSVTGAWSSRYMVNESTTIVPEYSTNPAADGWDMTQTYEQTEIEIFENPEPTDRVETSSLDDNKEACDYFERLVSSGILTNAQAREAQGVDHAVQGTDGYYYWGTTPVENLDGNWYYYDYYTGNNYNRWNCYVYDARYRSYTTTRYFRTVYVRYVTHTSTSDNSWVDWDIHANQTLSSSTAVYTYDGSHYQAKVYYDGLVYGINVSNNYTYTRATYQLAQYQNQRWYSYSEASNSRVWSNTRLDGLDNNHMYVIQITRTSGDYTLGRPELDGDKQSNDNVASPAFMIASQLGAVSSFGTGTQAAKNAAAHCSTYMEVATDGTRYTGWRLPTDMEVQVIIDYQGNARGVVELKDDNGETIYAIGNYRSMATVLSGSAYHSLDGEPASTGYGGNEVAVRCVRDLSAAEIEAINNQIENSGN